MTLRRAAPSSSRSTSSGSCRCGRCVANAQYLQCDTQVRDSDSVTLRENVTRRRIGAKSMAASLHRPRVRRPRRPRSRCRWRSLAGCGSTTGADRPGAEATLLLDFTPNAVHAGIYMAVDRGFDEAEGVELDDPQAGARRPTR